MHFATSNECGKVNFCCGELKFFRGIRAIIFLPHRIRLPVLFLCTHPYSRQGFRSHSHSYFLLSILLLLAGNVNLNPGPPYTSSSLYFSHLKEHQSINFIKFNIKTYNECAVMSTYMSEICMKVAERGQRSVTPIGWPS